MSRNSANRQDVDDVFAESESTAPARGSSRNVLLVVWQRRWLVLLGVVAGGIFGLLAFSQRPPVYRASAQVLVVKKQASNALPVAGGDPRVSVMEDYVATHLILIRSPLVVERAVKKRKLSELRSVNGGDAVGIIRNGLIASREASKDASGPGGNNIINLSYSGSDSGDVETVLLAVIESYREFLDETYRDFSDKTVELINSATETLQTNLVAKEKAYREFRRTSPLMIRGENGSNIHSSRILDFQRKETTFLEKSREIKNRLEAIEKAKVEGKGRGVIMALASRQLEKGQVVRETNDVAMESAMLPLLKQEAELSQFYGKDHPELLRVRRQMDMTKDFYKRLDEIARRQDKNASSDPVEAAIQALREELVLVEANHSALSGLLAEEVKKARALESYEMQDEGFRNDISRITKVLDQTLKRLEEINLVRGYGGFEARPIAPPTAGGKVSPVFSQFMLMGLALGFGAGVGIAFLLDVLDKSFRTPEEIRRRLGMAIVGHVPFSSKSSSVMPVRDSLGRVYEVDGGLVALHHPSSPESEAFRGVRTALFFNTHGEGHKVVQVTSPNMGDGKTTLITNLAVSIAQTGRRVLLIDADLRRPRVHRAFGVNGRIGLAELIMGTAELESAVQPTAASNLWVLPCGRRPTNPAELLTSPRLEDVLEDARAAYDFVLVDTPPLLAVSDPCIVAPRVDAVLLTIRVSKNGRPAAERARDLLTASKVNCIGVVVNGVGKQGTMSGYGYDHYKYADEYSAGYTATDEEATQDDAPRAALSPTRIYTNGTAESTVISNGQFSAHA